MSIAPARPQAHPSSAGLADPARLEALRRLDLIGAESVEAFDRLAALASTALGVPMAFVNFLDAERTHFAAAVGAPGELAGVTDCANDVSFCSHTLARGDTLTIDDSRRDERTRDNPILDLGFAAYAGVPLVTSAGHALGTLCVFDTSPRSWEPRQVDLLRGLAESVMSEIELRAARAAERERGERLERAVAERTELLRRANSDLAASAAELRRSREETVRRLSLAVEVRNEETGAHIDRTSLICGLLGERLGLPADRCELLRIASPLHDVGKIAIPDAIISKPGPLTSRERAIMETHAERGHEMLRGSGEPMLELAALLAWTHHERIDGTGYPRRLRGEAIPVEGRIMAVADVFDALTNDRVYRPAMPLERALEIIREGRGGHFDPAVVDALIDSLDVVLALAGRAAASARGAR